MNILHFGSNYLPNNGGNVLRMRNIVENNSHYDNIYVYTSAEGRKHFDDLEYTKKTGIKILRYKSLRDTIKNLKIIVKKHKIQIVITHIIPANIIACCVLSKEVIIATEIHSLIQSKRPKMIGKNLVHRFFLSNRTKVFFVLSSGAKKYILKNYNVRNENIMFLPNGTKECFYEKIQVGNQSFFTFGYVGTFYAWQGINIIRKNIEKILQIDPKVRIYLVGSGQGYEELFNMSKKKQYKGRLIITGMVPQEDIGYHMQQIDVLMIPRPSTLETNTAIPLKIFEGVYYGKPMIISNVDGLIEVLDNDSAFVFDPKDEGSLTAVCKIAFSEASLRNDKFLSSVKKIANWPSWSEIQLKQYNELKKIVPRKIKPNDKKDL